VSNNESLGIIYEQVYNKLKKNPNVLGVKRGKLYAIICEILGESDLQSRQQITQKICNEVKVSPNNRLDDDLKVIEELLSEVFIERSIPEIISTGVAIVKNFTNPSTVSFNQNEDNMKLLVIVACILVGVYFCIQYLDSNTQKKNVSTRSPNSSEKTPPTPPTLPIPAKLCLIVPASSVSTFQIDSYLDGKSLKMLINSASYFLSKSPKQVENIETKLDFSTESIPQDSPKEVYIRVEIKNGREMLDKETRYEIKENVQDSEQYKIEDIRCLWTLSGLESFIRF